MIETEEDRNRFWQEMERRVKAHAEWQRELAEWRLYGDVPHEDVTPEQREDEE